MSEIFHVDKVANIAIANSCSHFSIMSSILVVSNNGVSHGCDLCLLTLHQYLVESFYTFNDSFLPKGQDINLTVTVFNWKMSFMSDIFLFLPLAIMGVDNFKMAL